MSEQTLEALRGSIAKWEAIVERRGTDKGNSNCPLCVLFYEGQAAEDECVGCPVYEKTWRRHCVATPYIEWYDAGYEDDPAKYSDAQLVVAREELEFLKSLLPKGAAWRRVGKFLGIKARGSDQTVWLAQGAAIDTIVDVTIGPEEYCIVTLSSGKELHLEADAEELITVMAKR